MADHADLADERIEQHRAAALARQVGKSDDGGIAIDFPLRRKDVADISGTTLHTASRILTAWEKAGFLVSDNQRLTIRRPSDIQRIADGLFL